MRTRSIRILGVFLVLIVPACGGGSSGGPPLPINPLAQLDSQAAGLGYVDLAVNAAGGALVVWTQDAAGQSSVWANRFVPGSGWSGAELAENLTGGGVFGVSAALDANGDGWVAFVYQTGALQLPYVNRYQTSGGWGTAVSLTSASPSTCFIPDIAVDGAGNAYGVWTEFDGTRNNAWANRFDRAANTWMGSVALEAATGDTTFVQVGADNSGNAITCWAQSNGTILNAFTNRFVTTPVPGWGGAVLLETLDTGDVGNIRLSVGADGSATAAWHQLDGATPKVFGNHFTPVGGWDGPVELQSAAPSGNFVSTAANGGGDGLACWAQTGATTTEIWTRRFVAGSGWTLSPVLVGAGTNPAASGTALKNSDEAFVTWTETVGLVTEGRIALSPATTWNAGQALPGPGVAVNYPIVAVDGTGGVFVVWMQDNGGTYDLWGNRF